MHDLLLGMQRGSDTSFALVSLKTQVASRFAPGQQKDSQEFLVFLLDGLHDELARAVKPAPRAERDEALELLPPRVESDIKWKEYCARSNSFVLQCFHGQLSNQLTCSTCGKASKFRL